MFVGTHKVRMGHIKNSTNLGAGDPIALPSSPFTLQKPDLGGGQGILVGGDDFDI